MQRVWISYSTDVKIFWAIAFLTIFMTITGFGTTVTILSNTNWGSITTGTGGGPPTSSDAVIVQNNAIVFVNIANAVCSSLQLGGTVAGSASGSISFNSGSKLTVSGNVKVGAASTRNGTITMTNGGTLICSTFSTGGGTSTLSSGTGTIQITGATSLLAGFTAYNNLTINSSGTVTSTGNFTCSGDLTVSAGTLNLSTFTANRTASGGTLTLASGANLTIAGTNGIPSNYATHNFNAASTVTYSGTTQSIGAEVFGNLTITSGTVTLAASDSVNGNVIISGGTLDLGIFTIYHPAVGGLLDLSAGATMRIGGTNGLPHLFQNDTFDPASTIEFYGSNQSFSGTYGNLIITNGGIKTLTQETWIEGSLTLNNGSTLSGGASNQNLILFGNWINNGGTFSGGTDTVIFQGATSVSIGGTAVTTFGSLMVNNNSQTVNLSTNISITEDLSVSSGKFVMGLFTANRSTAGGTLSVGSLATLSIGGTNSLPSNYSSHSFNKYSIVIFIGSNQTVPAGTYGNLTISASGTTTVGGSLVLLQTLVISTGSTLSAGSNTISVGYNWVESGTFTPGTSTVTFNGSFTQTISGLISPAFNNLIINDTLTSTTLSINVTVAGDLTINSGTYNLSTFTSNRTAAGGTLAVHSGGTLRIAGTNTIPSNFSTHTFDTTSTVEYYGSAQSVGAYSYGNLLITNAGTKTLAGPTIVAGALTITAGTLAAGANGITVGADYTNNGGSFTSTTSFNLNGTGAQSIGGSTATAFATLRINKTGGTATMAVNATCSVNLTIVAGTLDLAAYTVNRTASGGTLSVSSGATLRVGGTNPLPANYSTHAFSSTSTVEFYASSHSVGTDTYGNFLISGGTTTLTANITIAGDLAISGGTLDLVGFTANRSSGGGTLSVGSSGTLRIGGSNTLPSNFSAHSFNAASTVEFYGVTQNVPSDTYGNLTISSVGTKTAIGPLVLDGNLAINLGATFSSGNNNISLAGSWTNNGTFSSGTDTVTFAGSSPQAIGGIMTTIFNNLTVLSSGSTVTLVINTAVSGNLLIQSGTYDLAAYTSNRTSPGGTLSVSGPATLRIGGTNSLPSNYTTHNFAQLSTVEFYGTNQSVDQESYGALTISGIGTKTLAGSITLGWNLLINSGATLSAGADTITLSSGWTNNGSFLAGSGTVSVSGSIQQTIGGTDVTTFNNLIINNTSGNVQMIYGNIVSGTLTLTSGTVAVGLVTVAAISGGSSTSYIDGTLAHHFSSNGTFNFSVGSTGYAPVSFTVTSGTGTVNVSSTNSAPLTVVDSTHTLGRYWTLGGNGMTADVIFSYPASEIHGTEATFTAAEFNGLAWDIIPSTVNSVQHTVTVNGLNSFTDWTVGEAASLPIELSSLSAANTGNNNVSVHWSTITETNTLGFYVERRGDDEKAFKTISSLIAAAGTSLQQHDYSYNDEHAATGTFYYRLKQVDADGATTYSLPIKIVVTGILGVQNDNRPAVFNLSQNYPNPFNPATTIEFSVAKQEHAVVTIYDILGRELKELYNGVAQPGKSYTVQFDATALSSGIYFYRLVTDSRTEFKRMSLIK